MRNSVIVLLWSLFLVPTQTATSKGVSPEATAYIDGALKVLRENFLHKDQIYLVVGMMVDRKGNAYPDGVTPDQEILSEATISTNDPVIHGASDWLLAQRLCRAGGHLLPD